MARTQASASFEFRDAGLVKTDMVRFGRSVGVEGSARLVALLGIVSGVVWVQACSGQQDRLFQDAQCRVSFAVPAGWQVRPDSSEFARPCTFVMRPTDWQRLLLEADSIDYYTTLVSVIEGPPENAADSAGFSHGPDGWILHGRLGVESPGVAYTRGDLRGATGMASAGCYRIGDGYAGACDAPGALVGNDRRSVAIWGLPRADEVVTALVQSVAFHD